MTSTRQARADWNEVHAKVRRKPRRSVRVGREALAHPRDAGARPTATWPVGQIADYAVEGRAGKAPLVVREFPDHFEAFVDTIELGDRVVRAIETNPSGAMLLGGALLGGAIGASMTNKREGGLLGAGLGVLLAAVLNERTKQKPRS